MNRRSFSIFAGALAFWLGSWPATAADSVVGTWQLTGFSQLVLDTNETIRPFGEQPVAGYIQYSPGGHMVVFLQAGNPIRIAGSDYTDAERVAVYKSIFGAYAGTYSVEGNKIVH